MKNQCLTKSIHSNYLYKKTKNKYRSSCDRQNQQASELRLNFGTDVPEPLFRSLPPRLLDSLHQLTCDVHLAIVPAPTLNTLIAL